VICGLDSVPARRWINSTLVSLLAHDDDGNVDLDTVVPYIDAGTEGFKGHTRVIFPGVTSCLECTIELFPPTEKVPLCTVAATPRNAAHCIQ
jgi:ubiquitin-activating enzyme E1 C